jgi:hypothetical protein
VLRRRNGGRNKACNIDYQQDDNYIRHELIRKVGCVPPHWRLHMKNPSLDVSTVRDCSNQEEMSKVQTPQPSFVHTDFLQNFTAPCSSIFDMSLKKETIVNDDLGKTI